ASYIEAVVVEKSTETKHVILELGKNLVSQQREIERRRLGESLEDKLQRISELNSQLEKKKGMLESLENLDYTLKKFEGFLKIKDTLTGLGHRI
ncbi:hypothetical protein M8C21_031947, partial [Ambrosia artemisiifolia]